MSIYLIHLDERLRSPNQMIFCMSDLQKKIKGEKGYVCHFALMQKSNSAKMKILEPQ